MSTATAEIIGPNWRDVVWPKEHGSWSLAFEPLALGLIAAPSLAGASVAGAMVAAFFCRRPLRMAWLDDRAERRAAGRRAILACGAVVIAGLAAAVVLQGVAWLLWLTPTVVAGCAFLAFDLQREGREQPAEVAGAVAFASLPAAFAVLAGWSWPAAASLAAVMLARAVPTVLVVRATVRARKTHTHPSQFPLTAAALAAFGVVGLTLAGLAPRTAAALAVALAGRAFILLRYPRPALRASVIGLIEAGLGVAYVGVIALTW